jgi:Ca2+-binding RTX toxin-like protein
VTTLENSAGTGTFTLTRLADGSTNALTIAAEDRLAATDGATTFTAVSGLNEETITLTSGSNAAEDLTVTTLTVADLTTLNLTGTADAVITNAIAGGTALATVDASGLTGAATVNASASNVNITMTAGAGVATFTGGSANDTITGGGAADILTGGGGADTLTGGAGADTLAGGASNDIITGGAGADIITGGSGVDTITGGAGADIVTGGLGADVIDITGTGAIDTLIMTTGGAIGIDVVTGFDVATAANSGDNVDIDLSDINGVVGKLLLADGNSNAATAAPVLTTVSAAYDMGGAASDILLLTGNFSSTGEVETALETGGALALTSDDATANYATTDAFLVMYDNGSDSFLATFAFTTDPGDNAAFAAADTTVTNLMQFVGIDDATTFISNNFDIIA